MRDTKLFKREPPPDHGHHTKEQSPQVAKRWEEIRRLHAEGLRDPKIATLVGMTPNAVKHARHKMGLPGQPPPRQARSAEVAELHKLGMTDGEMAERLGVSRPAVTKARNRAGLPRIDLSRNGKRR